MQNDNGKYIIIIGVFISIIGVIWYFFGDKLHWIGHLPGDIQVKRDGFSFYFPITTMIIFSIIINVILRVFRG